MYTEKDRVILIMHTKAVLEFIGFFCCVQSFTGGLQSGGRIPGAVVS